MTDLSDHDAPIWVITMAGMRTLTPGGLVSSYDWSSDSSRIVYRADEETDGVSELYSAAPGGGTIVKISGPLIGGPGVSNFAVR